MFNLLPFLKGWRYKTHHVERSAVVRGADPIEALRLDETAWLLAIFQLTTDAYGTLNIQWQGGDLETLEVTMYPELIRSSGSIAFDTTGYLTKYARSNPNSTLGIYSVMGFQGGFSGAVWPYVPTTVISMRLQSSSTQETAYIAGDATVVAISDKKEFIRSLRRTLDPNASLKIDPALLSPGLPAWLKEES